MIEEIVVTAQKREQNLAEVPISVSVLDSDFMVEQNITDFRDVSLYTANFRVNNIGGGNPPPDLRLRGFGTARANRAFEQAVGLSIDGDTFGQQEFFRAALFDVDRIEVLKGPQGTLFGKNTTAGLVNLVLKRPTDKFEGFVDLQGGQFNWRRIEGAVGGPLVAGIANFRIAGVIDEAAGYMKNTTARTVPEVRDLLGGWARNGLRGTLAFPSLWGTSLLLLAEQSKFKNFELPTEFLEVRTQAMRDLMLKYDPNADFIGENWVGSIDHPSGGARQFQRFALNASTTWGGWGLDAVIGHARLAFNEETDTDGSPVPVGWAIIHDGGNQTTFELRASSPSLPGFLGVGQFLGLGLGRSEFTAGLYHQRRLLTTNTRLPINGGAVGDVELATQGISPPPVPSGQQIREGGPYFVTTSDFSQHTLSYAAFGQMSWHLAERWTLEPGMRGTYETKDANVARFYDNPQSAAFFNQVLQFETFNVPLSRSEFAFTPKVALIYHLADEVNVYASWAKGYKSGGFNENGTGVAGLTFKPEGMKAWELGTKTRFLDGAAMLNFALFWMNATDIQLYTFEPSPNGVQFGLIHATNAGEGRSRGFEADAMWLPTSWLTLRDSLGFLDTVYLSFPIGSCEPSHPNTDGDSDPRCDLTGKPFEFSPKWVNSLTTSVRLPLESLASLGLPLHGVDLLNSLAVHYEDVHFANDTAVSEVRQPRFFTLDAHLGLGNVAQGWSVTVGCRNLTDQFVSLIRREFTAKGVLNSWNAPPRQIFGSLRWAF